MKKFISIFVLGLMLMSCGPSPESMAKKNCDLYKKYREAEAANDSASMKKYADEMTIMDRDLKEKHKNNPDWLTTYALERDACIIREMQKEKQ